MAEYKGIKGFKVQYLSADPSNPIVGQIWYNDTSKNLKYTDVSSTGTWATGGNTPDSVYGRGGFGTQTATIGAGGGDPITANAFSYDGSTWTATTSLPAARQFLRGAGTQTAGLAINGYDPTGYISSNLAFDGSTWTSIPPTNQTHSQAAAAGHTQTAALIFGSGIPPTAGSELWDGTSWTVTPSLNTGREQLAGIGTSTSAVGAGGQTSPAPKSSAAESWNGTTWTSISSIPTATSYLSGTGSSNTAGLIFGGATGPGEGGETSQTTLWNGTAWAADTDMLRTSGRIYKAQSGNSNLTALCFNGANPWTNATEEYTAAGVAQTKTITVS